LVWHIQLTSSYRDPHFKANIGAKWVSYTCEITILQLRLLDQGELIIRPGKGANVTADVYRDDVVRVEGSAVSESGNGECLNIIFNARVAAAYTIFLKCNGVLVREFPLKIR